MPNWCYNSLVLEGSEQDIKDVKAQLNQPFEMIHDRWIQETNLMTKHTIQFTNPVFAFWNIKRPIDMEAYIEQPDHTLDIKEAMLHKGNHWYDFNIREWGTKWDVAVSPDEKYPDTELLEDESTMLVYKFNTAWAPPLPAMEKLSEQYPSLKINLEYEEETGWGGEIEFSAGEGNVVNQYEGRCSNCAFEYSEDLKACLHCESDICPNCNHGTWNGEECKYA